MTGDCHVRFCEGLGGKLPGATRLLNCETGGVLTPQVIAFKIGTDSSLDENLSNNLYIIVQLAAKSC
jgi:hypothetical protein